ncbi:hypothetical protein [Sessilibacter corallicola]|uniref:hypothetical protein n=1 Tax=Sessilibacter corallicola TaxID=2904075 RepID=UPI001E4C7CE6|nr:hypothetical protein [Sessilibacter corallicola]MCE2026785.1 hypothetical protein [Sessilibacter corallicola]
MIHTSLFSALAGVSNPLSVRTFKAFACGALVFSLQSAPTWAQEETEAVKEQATDTPVAEAPAAETPAVEHNASVISEQSNVDDFQLVLDVQVDRALNQVNPALSADGYMVADSISYRFSVLEVVKGNSEAIENTLSVNIPFSACHRILTKGSRYFLQVNPDKLGEIQIDSCDNFASIPMADDVQQVANGGTSNPDSKEL